MTEIPNKGIYVLFDVKEVLEATKKKIKENKRIKNNIKEWLNNESN